jgi:subtilisin family serine protease
MNPTKLHATLAASMMTAKSADQTVPIIVKVRPGPLARGEARALSMVVPKSEFRLLGARAVDATAEMIAQLTDDPAVDLIWPDLPVHSWLDDAVPRIRAPRVWDSGFTGKGVRVAVLDTGLDGAHPDFQGRIRLFQDFVDEGNTDPIDPNGHGTHVTGIAAGSGAGSDGRYTGVAPEADLFVARVLDAGGGGRTSDVMAGIEWAVERGAQVINISLGGPPYPADGTDALSMLVDAAVEAGVVVCVAAGNMGPGVQTVGAPAASKGAITIGAAEVIPDGGGERVATFSSRGPTADARNKPDLIVPGVGIVSARSAGTNLGHAVNQLYTSLQGTSQATPLATGTTALLLQSNPRFTPEEVKARMVRGARRLPGYDTAAQGAGRGDAYNTFISAQGAPLGAEEPALPPEAVPRAAAGCLGALAALFVR